MQIEPLSDAANVGVALVALSTSILLSALQRLPELDSVLFVPVLHMAQIVAALVAIASGSVVILKAFKNRFKD